MNEYPVETEFNNTKVKIVLHSLLGIQEIITYELFYPRMIHSEFMTHRMFSRNASSSRAIPVTKESQIYIPPYLQENKAGMQGGNYITGSRREEIQEQWKIKALEMLEFKHKLGDKKGFNVHKQWANRPIEWADFISVVVTATEWDNFFKLRIDEAAQPEIYHLALLMRSAKQMSTPIEREYHFPYAENIQQSVARCARVSYRNHDNSDTTYDEDLLLYQRLLSSGHLSPFEHQALKLHGTGFQAGITHMDRDGVQWSGNFKNCIQYRQLLSN